MLNVIKTKMIKEILINVKIRIYFMKGRKKYKGELLIPNTLAVTI